MTLVKDCISCEHSMSDHRYKGKPNVCTGTRWIGNSMMITGICGCLEHAYDKIDEVAKQN